MIAADSSTLIAFLQSGEGRDVEVLDSALRDQQVLLPPVVLCELLSDPRLPQQVYDLLLGIPQLETTSGYWERSGLLRARILAKGLKARLADILIAQSCIDADVPLLARDPDYRHFARLGGLRLAAV